VTDFTYYCVTVDTEEEWDWASGYPTGPTRVTNVRQLERFQELCDKYHAPVVYFTNHAVLADPDGRAVMRELVARPQVEIGLHIHPWNTPPRQAGETVPVRDSFLHNLPWDLARAKLDSLFEVFDQAGVKPTSFRGGRYSTSPQIQDHLRDRGVVADCSVLPFSTWPDDGAPDHRARDLTPRRLPPRHPGDAAMWELPLTFGWTRRPFGLWNRVFRTVEETPLRYLKIIGILDKLGIARKAWLNLENPAYPDPAGFVPVVATAQPPAVCFTLHSSSLMPGGSPYTRTEADLDRLYHRAEAALQAAAACPTFRPATATQTAQHLETAHHARVGDQPTR
jgi:hypothetical protein